MMEITSSHTISEIHLARHFFHSMLTAPAAILFNSDLLSDGHNCGSLKENPALHNIASGKCSGFSHTPQHAFVIESFFVLGFSHHQSNASLRSALALSSDQKETLFAQASVAGLGSLIILNTCNRTELYGHGQIQDAEKLFFRVLGGRPDGA